jgi:Holliday junction DNA helicase RuvA
MLAWKPSQVARAIADRDAKALATLPEVGKRVAEKIIAELDGKVEKFLDAQSPSGVEPKPTRAGALGPVAEDAVAALIALGQSRDEAVKSVEVALARRGKALAPASVQELVEAVFRVGA